MRQSYALFSRRLTPRLWVEDWGTYAPAPEAATPDAPPLVPYVFRKGGFWQPTKFWLLPAPPERAVPDAPPLTPYTFRRGGFWRIRQFLPQPADVVALTPPVVTPAPPLSAAHNTYVGSSGGFIAPELWRTFLRRAFDIRHFQQYDRAVMLYALGEITEEEMVAMITSIREYLASN